MNAALLEPPTISPPSAKVVPPKIEMSREEFEAWKPEPTGVKYEWKQGRVIFGENSMQATERFIIRNLTKAFDKTEASQRGGDLYCESDCYLPPHDTLRRPDLAFFTTAQLAEGIALGDPVPSFVIEVVSKNDNFNYYEDKLDDYFAAGVKVVWHVIPRKKRVRIYRADRSVIEVSGAHECSAAPVVPDFKITADDIFRTPEQP